MLNFRKSVILRGTGSNALWGASYLVTAYPVGAEASAGSAGTTITVRAGHSFRASDKFLLAPGSQNIFSGTDSVQSVTATSIVMGSSYSVASGDLLVNLGPDTGSSAPNFDGSPMKIYTDPAGAGSAATNATVTCDSQGEFEYYHKGDGRFWELIRSSATAVVEANTGFGGLYPRVNAVDHGASPEAVGSETDQSARIQSAIDAAGSTFGEVFLPSGSYGLTASGVTISKRIHLRGSGCGDPASADTTDEPASTLRPLAAVTAIQVNDGAHYSSISDLCVYSTFGSGTSPGIRIGQASSTNGVNKMSLRRVVVRGARGAGFRLSNGNLNTFQDCYAIANTGHGFDLDSEQLSLTNTNANTFLGCQAGSNGGNGFNANSSKSNIILGFDSESNTGWGFYIDDNGSFGKLYAEGNTSGALHLDTNSNTNWFFLTSSSGTITITNTNNCVYRQEESSGGQLRMDHDGDITVRKTLNVPLGNADFFRMGVKNATSLVAGDFAIGSNWGVGASVAVTGGSKDQHFEVTVTAAGAPGANPTLTLTFKDGAFFSNPFAACHFNGGTGSAAIVTWSSTTTTLVMTYVGTPVAGSTYKIAAWLGF